MAEATPQKRVLPARERADSSAKRLAASPATPVTPASEPRQKRKYTKRASLIKPSTSTAGSPAPTTSLEAVLPTRVYGSKILPTSSQKQSDTLSKKDYQSIAESAVLAASLHRSRMQWLCDGVFKRYWTKPIKRKGVIEQPAGNPDAKTMSKLGNATMTIEPHVFEVTFYTVKDIANIPPPYYRHPNQHTVKQPPPSNTTPTVAQPPPPSTSSVPSGTSATSTPAKSAPYQPVTTPVVKQETPVSQAKSVTSTQSNPATPTPTQHPIAHPPTQSVAPASASTIPPRPATDPVIKKLAERAATDDRLKELMKVVATSKAGPEQLKEFQAHIDEINRIIKQEDARRPDSVQPKQQPPPSASAAAHPATYNIPPRPHPGPPTSIGGPMHMAPPSHPAYPPPRPEPFIKHIVVEFHSTEAGTDRWLFPDYAVLDIRSGGVEMIASFFTIRKGEDILKQQADDGARSVLAQKLKPDVEYYQPVTILIKATQHRTIETIARAAKSLVECHKQMKEVMETKTRAPQEFLIHRLPREKALDDVITAEFVDSAIEMSNDEDDELKDVYGM